MVKNSRAFLCISISFILMICFPQAFMSTESGFYKKTTRNVTCEKQFCAESSKNYYVKEKLSVNLTAHSLPFGITLLNNGSFYILRPIQIGENSNKRLPVLEYYTNSGLVKFSKKLDIIRDINSEVLSSCLITSESNSYLYIICHVNHNDPSYSSKFYLVKLNAHGQILIKKIDRNFIFGSHLTFNKHDSYLYLTSEAHISQLDRYLTLKSVKSFSFKAFSDLIDNGAFMSQFDGVCLLKYDFNADKASIVKVRNDLKSYITYSSTIVNECLMVSVTYEFEHLMQYQRTTLTFLSLDTELLIVNEALKDFELSRNHAPVIASTQNFLLYVFDIFSNIVYVLDHKKDF